MADNDIPKRKYCNLSQNELNTLVSSINTILNNATSANIDTQKMVLHISIGGGGNVNAYILVKKFSMKDILYDNGSLNTYNLQDILANLTYQANNLEPYKTVISRDPNTCYTMPVLIKISYKNKFEYCKIGYPINPPPNIHRP